MKQRIVTALLFSLTLLIAAEAVLAKPAASAKNPVSKKSSRSNSAPSAPPANTQAKSPSKPKSFFAKVKSLFSENRSAQEPEARPSIAPINNPLSDDLSRPRYDYTSQQQMVQSSVQPRMNDVSLYAPVRSPTTPNPAYRSPMPFAAGNLPRVANQTGEPRPNQPIGPPVPTNAYYLQVAAAMQRQAPQPVVRNDGVAPPKPPVTPINRNPGPAPAKPRFNPQQRGPADQEPVFSSVQPRVNKNFDPKEKLRALVGSAELAALTGNRVADPPMNSPGDNSRSAIARREADARRDQQSEAIHRGPISARAVPPQGAAIGPMKKSPPEKLLTLVRRSNSPNSKQLKYRPGMSASELGDQLNAVGYSNLPGLGEPAFYKARFPGKNGGEDVPEQGWKIHVSADINDPAETIVRTFNVLESLRLGDAPPKRKGDGPGNRVVFKVWDPDKLNETAKSAPYQMGKYITIYPRDADEAVTIAKVLSRELPDSPNHIPVAGDKQAYLGKPVYLRYGAFTSKGDNHEIPAELRPAYKGQTSLKDDDLRINGIAYPDWKHNEWTQIRDKLNNGVVNEQQ